MKLEELARLAGVSKATASIILNGRSDRYRISKATQEKVLTLVKQYQYVPNAQAAGLRKNSSKLLALVIPDFMHRGFSELGKELERLARESGYQLLISCTDENPETEQELIKALVGRQVDAIITASSLPDDQTYKKVEERGIPVILVDRILPDSPFNHIISDDCLIAEQMTLLLMEHSCQQPIYLGGIEQASNSQHRFKGLCNAVQSSGLEVDNTLVFHRDFTCESGYEMIRDWHQAYNALPENLMTASFSLLEGVLRFVRDHFKEVPEHLNWGTLGDSYILDLLPFPIHSAPQNYKSMAEYAMTMLNARLSDTPFESSILLERQLIKRSRKQNNASAHQEPKGISVSTS